MAEHGKLFDNFTRQASHPHGGSYFDSGFSLQARVDTHGRLHDLFGVPQEGAAGHGQRFDEFGWQALPAVHGGHFDEDFADPTAHTPGEHGTWFDVFRGGTEVRFMLQGADYEGTVIECNRDYARVRDHAGQDHEVGLDQFLAYRTPNEQQASPPLPASSAEAPSAHSRDAAGGGQRTPVATSEPGAIGRVGEGPGNTDARTGAPEGLFDTFTAVKTLAERYDVEKDVDSTETAAQAQDLDGKHAYCPHCKHDCKKPTDEGTCPTCGTKVEVSKTGTGDLGIEVPERPHKTTDHHSTRRKPTRCPHCGGALDELDHQTAQGQPSRTHKCVGTGLDVLKTLEGALA